MHMESGSIQFQMNAEHMDFAPVENGSIYETGLYVGRIAGSGKMPDRLQIS